MPIAPFPFPRSSNRACRFPTCRLSDWFHRKAHGNRVRCQRSYGGDQELPSPHDRAPSEGFWSLKVLRGSSPITRSSPSSQAFQKSGVRPPPVLRSSRRIPGCIATQSLSDSRRSRRASPASRPLYCVTAQSMIFAGLETKRTEDVGEPVRPYQKSRPVP